MPLPPPSPPPPPQPPLTWLQQQQHHHQQHHHRHHHHHQQQQQQQQHNKSNADHGERRESSKKGIHIPPPASPSRLSTFHWQQQLCLERQEFNQGFLHRSASNRKQFPSPPPTLPASNATSAKAMSSSLDESYRGVDESNDLTALLFSPTFRSDRNLEGNVVKSIFTTDFWRGERHDNSRHCNESTMTGLSDILGNWDGGILERSNTIACEDEDEIRHESDSRLLSNQNVTDDDDARTALRLLDDVPINLYMMDSLLQDISFFPSPIRNTSSQDLSSHTILLDGTMISPFSPSEVENESLGQSGLGLRSQAKSTLSASEVSSLDFDYTNSALLEGEESSQEIPPRKQPEHYDDLHHGEESELLADNQCYVVDEYRQRQFGQQFWEDQKFSKTVESSSPLDYSDSGLHDRVARSIESPPLNISEHQIESLAMNKSVVPNLQHARLLGLQNQEKHNIFKSVESSSACSKNRSAEISVRNQSGKNFSKLAESSSESGREERSAYAFLLYQSKIHDELDTGNKKFVENLYDERLLGLAQNMSNPSKTAASGLSADHLNSGFSYEEERSAEFPPCNRSLSGNRNSLENSHPSRLERRCNFLGIFRKIFSTSLYFLGLCIFGACILYAVCRIHLQYLVATGKLSYHILKRGPGDTFGNITEM